jgi:hypothetical protein
MVWDTKTIDPASNKKAAKNLLIRVPLKSTPAGLWLPTVPECLG